MEILKYKPDIKQYFETTAWDSLTHVSGTTFKQYTKIITLVNKLIDNMYDLKIVKVAVYRLGDVYKLESKNKLFKIVGDSVMFV
jgi:hypothetical protein